MNDSVQRCLNSMVHMDSILPYSRRGLDAALSILVSKHMQMRCMSVQTGYQEVCPTDETKS